ncbi:MAG: transglycosylase SLT domain-containing protein [Hyphomicrobiales bacterium]|nr:transglycosylase SLT domain-containing protein [Hyphomicrobiales bacterium]
MPLPARILVAAVALGLVIGARTDLVVGQPLPKAPAGEGSASKSSKDKNGKESKDSSAAKASTSQPGKAQPPASSKSAKDKASAAKSQSAKAPPAKSQSGKAQANGKSDAAKQAKSQPAAVQTAKPSQPARFATAVPEPIVSADLAALKEAVTAARRGRIAQAEDQLRSISDPVARKLVEWAILRSDENSSVEFNRYMSFVADNPSWPAINLLRRRGEATLWSDRRDPAAVRAFFANARPSTTKGKFALARALLLQGDRGGAQALVREAWRYDSFSDDLEGLALDVFGDLITPGDHKARMDMRLYAEDEDGALRSARRAGGYATTIAKARLAVIKKAPNATAMLDALPSEAQRDVGVIFSRVQWLRRNDEAVEAAALIASIPANHGQTLNSDEWWIERRLVARKLLDQDDPKTAYRVARDAAIPSKDNYRAEHQFTAGWIALRFLNDPATAAAHFAKVAIGNQNPITLARAGYWQGRAAEALGRRDEARAHYESAARYSTAYYGQIARARLGHKDLVVRPAPEPAPRSEVARAIELLYAIDERDLIAGALAELGERLTDAPALAALGEVAAHHGDARAMLLLGKSALSRGLPFDHYAFPTVGIPEYRSIGPSVEPSVVYAIARQESTFNPRTISSARAMGLMQVTPAAGRHVAKKFGVSFDEKRLLSDQPYNVQLGAAELGELIDDYRGNYILTFAGYNAGRGRVKDWIERFGDPRDPRVDPIDWVEQIPFSETRNYVQRVLENLQVYRVRFGGGTKLLIEADLRRGGSTN